MRKLFSERKGISMNNEIQAVEATNKSKKGLAIGAVVLAGLAAGAAFIGKKFLDKKKAQTEENSNSETTEE
jgi:hypothetical protein